MTDIQKIELNEAIETIKKYCTEEIEASGVCFDCPFCSKGYNGCKLQTAPCEWETIE